MSAYPDWLSLREIDQRAGAPKGTAFRGFKALAPSLREGMDYRVLQHQQDHEVIEALRDSGRIYASSVNLVMLAPDPARRIIEALLLQRSQHR